MKLINLTKNNPIQFYLLSVVLFQIGSIVRLQLQSQAIGNSFRIVSVCFLLYSLYNQISRRVSWKYPAIYVFLIVWNVANLLLSVFFRGGLNLTRTFGEEGYVLSYMLPFLLFFNVSKLNVRNLLNCTTLFVVLAVVLILLNFRLLTFAGSSYAIESLMNETSGLGTLAQLPIAWSIPASIALMNLNYISKKQILLILFAYLFAIAFSMTFGRRTVTLYGLLFLFCAYVMFILNKSYKRSVKNKVTFWVCLSLCFIIPFALSTFSFLFDRGLEDTRSGVNEAFHMDMNMWDYIFGRGINGTYYDPMSIFDHINNQRTGHETGYLNVILHAGLLYLIPYVLVSVHSFYLGFFKSKNIWIKSLAIYVFINTIMLLIGATPKFNLRFFIVWIGIVFCNNKFLRAMDNKQISNYLNLDKS